jgi:hypothetical protein
MKEGRPQQGPDKPGSGLQKTSLSIHMINSGASERVKKCKLEYRTMAGVRLVQT